MGRMRMPDKAEASIYGIIYIAACDVLSKAPKF